MSTPCISAIVAVAENWVIGKDGGMCWHVPGDLKHFKQTTMGKPIIMGRKSYESLGKPLPGRANIVISRSMKELPNMHATEIHDTMEDVAVDTKPRTDEKPILVSTIEEAIEQAVQIAKRDNVDEIFITGGGEIYEQCMPFTEKIYLTVIHKEYDGDAFFPAINMMEWQEASYTEYKDSDPAYTISILERR